MKKDHLIESQKDDLDLPKMREFFEKFMKNIINLEKSDLPEILMMNLHEVFSLSMFTVGSQGSELGIHILSFVNKNKRVFLKYIFEISTSTLW